MVCKHKGTWSKQWGFPMFLHKMAMFYAAYPYLAVTVEHSFWEGGGNKESIRNTESALFLCVTVASDGHITVVRLM